jgi:hypothetical protein
MQRWGIPETIRMDNGAPWATQSPLPSALGLWLVGLGIKLTYGRPGCSTDNAVVERSHGVLSQWVDPLHCADFATCQSQLAWAVHTQRERYPACGTQTRLQAFPTLLTNQRRYDPAYETDLWAMTRLKTYLSQFVFRRRVEKYGQITLFANTYSIGRSHSRIQVEIRLDTQTDEWLVADQQGNRLASLPCKELDYRLISQLQLAKRRKT